MTANLAETDLLAQGKKKRKRKRDRAWAGKKRGGIRRVFLDPNSEEGKRNSAWK